MRKVSFIDFEEDEPEKIVCPMCRNLGFHALMGPKLILQGQRKEPDHDSWLQCPECAFLCPIYQAEPEAAIEDNAELIDSPYEQREGIVMGTENRQTQTKKRRKKAVSSSRVTRPTSNRRNKKLKLDEDPEINYLLEKYGDNVKVIK
jgi:hypothetical protein